MKKIKILSNGILILFSFILINCSKKQDSPLPPKEPTSITPTIQPVVSIASNQIIFHNLKWICPMGCTIEIKTIYDYISSTTPIQVFIKKTSDVNWVAVPLILQVSNYDSFSYQINTNSWLVVYTESDINTEISYDVKIVY